MFEMMVEFADQIAFDVKKAGMTISAEELTVFAGNRLAPFKIPAEFRLLASLPLGKTGNVDKMQLKAAARRTRVAPSRVFYLLIGPS